IGPFTSSLVELTTFALENGPTAGAHGTPSSAPTSLTSASTIAWTSGTPAAVMQAPLPSALMKELCSLVNAFDVQAGSTGVFFSTAFRMQLRMPDAYFPVALYFAEEQAFGPGPPSVVPRSAMKASTLPSIAAASPVVAHGGFASAFVKLDEN